MTTVAVLLSGGLDSTAAMSMAHYEADLVLAITADYGQRHAREIDSARLISDKYRTPLVLLDLTGWGRILKGYALTDPTVKVPDTSYDNDSMALTVVPNRNATLLMASAGVAQAMGIEEIWIATHSGDHVIYADCRPEFIETAARAVYLGTDGLVRMRAPFVQMTKTQVVSIGAKYDAPFELSWSCYKGGKYHCGTCGTCRERIDAFECAGLKDPTNYKKI